MRKFIEPVWIVMIVLLAFFWGRAEAGDPRRESPKPSPWLEIPGAWAEGQENYAYLPVMVYAQCDGSTRVFVAVMAGGASSTAQSGSVSVTAVPGGCERTKAEEPR